MPIASPERAYAGGIGGTFTAAALTVALCVPCLNHDGLCERHAKEVLPQLAQPGWVRLIGIARVEQTKAQQVQEVPVSPQQASWRERRKAARKTAKSKRRGMYGLLRAIAAAGHTAETAPQTPITAQHAE